MKTTEFKNFMANIERLGLESTEVQSAGYAWLALTYAQVEKVIQYAVEEKGYRPDKKGNIKIGAYTLKMSDTYRDHVLAHDLALELTNKKGDKQMSKKNTTPADTQPAQNTEQPTEAPAPVEVLKGEVIDTKQEKAINAAIDRISKKVENIGKGYLDIVGDVARLRSLEAWKVTGHKSLYDLCADKFGMARGTVANLEAVFKKYGDPETFKLTDACAGMSLREMLAAISEEKKALKGEVAGEPADGEESGEAGDKGGKKKAETLISITWELAGDDWNVDAILEEIRKQLEANPDAKEAFPDGANVSFTITH